MQADTDMPTHPSANETFLRVMADHDVTQSDLAAALGCHRGTLSRMCNGSISVSMCAAIELFARTRDTRLIRVFAADAEMVVLDNEHPAIRASKTIDTATALIALAAATQRILNPDALKPAHAPATTRVIDDAIEHLLRLRRRITRGENVPFHYRQANRLPDPLTA